MNTPLENRIFSIESEGEFELLCLELYHAQYEFNPVYRQYCQLIGAAPERRSLSAPADIPFLPIGFFKTHRVTDTRYSERLKFRSSGTGNERKSTHYVASPDLYQRSFMQTFRQRFPPPEELCILGLLPSYLEQGESSLVYMVDRLIRASGHPQSGFFLHDLEELVQNLNSLNKEGTPTLLFGVTYALLDLAEKYPMELNSTIVVETGGMKGRRKEITRQELHHRLKEAFRLNHIYSEYGMTELLSQAYTDGTYRFYPPPWMRVLIRETQDPLTLIGEGRTGGVNLIDLANAYSCPFIETQDLGKSYEDGSFEILGRFDHSDVRGCNLLVS